MDRELLRRAIKLAQTGVEMGGGPFGALIMKDSQIISEAHNKVTLTNDPTAHAEIVAIRKASEVLGTWDLSGCDLYTSSEPCPMCLGAIYWAHIDSVFFGATIDDARNAGFIDADLYAEIRKDKSARRIQMQSALREESLAIFEKWNNKKDKIQY